MTVHNLCVPLSMDTGHIQNTYKYLLPVGRPPTTWRSRTSPYPPECLVCRKIEVNHCQFNLTNNRFLTFFCSHLKLNLSMGIIWPSNINKLAERVVLKQLTEHLDAQNLNISYQSGYKKHHSTETLLVRIVNDTLVASDEGSATIVMLLDLSAAFDKVDHQKLLHILKQEIGIDVIALKWFTSFLCGRCQKVKVSNSESCEIIIKFGMPKALSLGQSSSTFISALYTVPFISWIL